MPGMVSMLEGVRMEEVKTVGMADVQGGLKAEGRVVFVNEAVGSLSQGIPQGKASNEHHHHIAQQIDASRKPPPLLATLVPPKAPRSSRRAAATMLRGTGSTLDETPVISPMMRTDVIQRTSSEGSGSSGPGSKLWRLRTSIKKMGMNSSKEDKPWVHKSHSNLAESETNDSLLNETGSASNVLLENPESNFRQLQVLVQRMRSAPSGPNHVDAAYKEFAKIKDQCAALCRAILQEELKRARDIANGSEVIARRGSSIESPRSPSGLFDTRSSFSGRSLAEVVTGSVGKGPSTTDTWLSLIRDWKTCLESLTEAFKTSLADTYKSYERDATQEMVDALFASKRFRREAVHRMRNASVTRVMSADPQFFPRYEIRFRNYEKTKQEASDIRNLLQAGESGISPDRAIEEFPIAPHGDVILEFCNTNVESAINDPVLRFRVSSYMLAETSPIFARMFSGQASSLQLHDDDDISVLLPSAPTKYICKDGSEAKLYRMPQCELNRLGSLEILLHAAHMHNEKVPREISFEQFVAIAECCMRYKSTSPLELMVEHRWLPQWMHKGADDMPDGLLVISYAFGLRQLFARMSKTAILNLVDERELEAKPWPRKIKDKIWAVRCAKVAQVHACCISTAQEYIRPSSPHPPEQPESPSAQGSSRGSFLAATGPSTALTSVPRCPKGSHWCDATNLGWLMLVYNEMNLLCHIMLPNALSHLPASQPQPRSLAQIVEHLKKVPGAPAPVHRGGVCDPGPAFRAAVNDIYNSVSGLTLYDISGKSHGWALSKHREREPQTQLATGLGRMAMVDDHSHSVVTEFPEAVQLQIFGEIDELDDLHSAAMTSQSFYETYKKHELFLMRNILRQDRRRAGTLRRPVALSLSNAEEKILKTESDVLKAFPSRDGADAVTLHSDNEDDDEDYSDFDDDMSIYGSVAPSTHQSISSRGPQGLDQRRSIDPLRIRTGGSVRTPRPQTANSSAGGSPTTPRQVALEPSTVRSSSPAKPTVYLTEDINEPPLTEEEAHRILWPESAIRATAPLETNLLSGVEGLREKFRRT
ncbi:hypothetical protein G7046_g10017 [Stylonectria norvegica]|nr:hypothetical protein G7046_g10017 [Stylonectria norvegica]